MGSERVKGSATKTNWKRRYSSQTARPGSIFGERAKRARHSQVCSIENRGYIYILLASERSERDTLRSVQLRIADIYIYIYIVRATVQFLFL